MTLAQIEVIIWLLNLDAKELNMTPPAINTSRFALLVGALLLTGCAGQSEYKLFQTKIATDTNQTVDESMIVTARSIEYRILPQDRLDVTLYKDPEQNAMVALPELGQSVKKDGILVNTAGSITLPLIGKVKVAGLTQTAASDKITKAYRRYINTPSVYLEVLNKRLFVLGEVKKPGVVKIDKEKMTLFEALAFAGDLTDSAVRNDIIILSANAKGDMNMRHVNLTNFDVMDYSKLMLRPNDIVYIQPNNWKQFKVASNDMTSIFTTISKVVAPFVQIKYLDK